MSEHPDTPAADAASSPQPVAPAAATPDTAQVAAADATVVAHVEAKAEAEAEAEADAPAQQTTDDQAQAQAEAEAGSDPAPEAPSSAAAAPTPAVPELSPAQCSAKLAALFPALFSLQQPLPLKLRIQTDIQQRAPHTFTRKSLSIFLHRYTTGTPYLQALSRVPQRYDLDGQQAGEVSAEHRDAATAEVARRRALLKERRAAEQAGRGAGGPGGRGPARQGARGSDPAAAEATAQLPAQPSTQPAAEQGTPGAAAAPVAVQPRRPPRPQRLQQPHQPHHPHQPHQPHPAQRPQQRQQAQQPQRPPGRDQQRPGPDGARSPRPERPPAGERRQPQHARPDARPPAAQGGNDVGHDVPPPRANDPESQARRERAALLRAWEGSTLTKANFCALKGLREADLDAQLALARQDVGARPDRSEPRPARADGPQSRHDHGPRGPRSHRG